MKYALLIIVFWFSNFATAQNQTVNWLSFEDLDQALLNESKKVMIHFYADWCVYCKKMEQDVYTKSDIKTELATNYYAVKFNVESTDTIQFGGKKFLNLNVGKKRMAYHQIAELIAGQNDKEMILPAVVFFDETFTIKKREFRYIPPKELLRLLQD